MSAPKLDIYQSVTDRILTAIKAGAGPWQRPWFVGSNHRRPANIASGRSYRGINTLALWVEAQLSGYSSHQWGSYRQWAALGGQVRRGEKAAQVVFFKELRAQEDADAAQTTPDRPRPRLFARTTPVFNADQVDNLPASPPPPPSDPAADVPSVDLFVARLGADIRHGGNRACYLVDRDQIHMPSSEAFVGSPTSTATENYYSTLLHELTHWTAPSHRCDRQLRQRFGSDEYAMEELVAELGAAFLCADLSLTGEPRADHAQYLAHWLKVLKADKRAIFTAASKAAQATDFLLRQATSPDSPPSTDVPGLALIEPTHQDQISRDAQ